MAISFKRKWWQTSSAAVNPWITSKFPNVLNRTVILDLGDETDTDTAESDTEVLGPHKKMRTESPSASQRDVKDSRPMSFLALPGEIRNYIYQLAFSAAEEETTLIVTESKYDLLKEWRVCLSGWRRPKGSQLRRSRQKLPAALLMVNHQVRDEATPFLYSRSFAFEDFKPLLMFLSAIGSAKRAAITGISIQGGVDYHESHNFTTRFSAFAFLSDCINLERLALDNKYFMKPDPIDKADWLFSEAYVFMEAYGAAKRRADAVVDIISMRGSCFRAQISHRNRQGRSSAEIARVVANLRDRREAQFFAELRRLLIGG